jgi:hypothetical protein
VVVAPAIASARKAQSIRSMGLIACAALVLGAGSGRFVRPVGCRCRCPSTISSPFAEIPFAQPEYGEAYQRMVNAPFSGVIEAVKITCHIPTIEGS